MTPDIYKNIRVLTAWDEGNDIKLVCKILDESTGQWKRGVKTIENYKWYFTIEYSDYEKRAVQSILNNYHDKSVVTELERYNDKWLKIYAKKAPTADVKYSTATSSQLRHMLTELKREGVTLYESDLSIWKRFMIDNFMIVADDLDILYFDIETDDTQGGIDVGKHTILSWAGMNDKGETFYSVNDESTGGEKQMLLDFLNCLQHHDIFAGWNSSSFDLPYIQARLLVHNIDSKDLFKRKMHIDLMQRCAKVYSYNMFNIGLKGFSLNEVARVFLNEQKVVHEEGITEMWLNNRELLKEYNIKDVELLYELDKKLLITDLMIKECQWTGSFLDRFFIGELLDNYILRRTREMKTFQFARPDWTEKGQLDDISIRGGYVMKPIPGVYDNVRVCDFKSLYPSLMVGFNMGRDSLNREMSDDGYVAMCKFLHTGTPDERKIEDTPFVEWKEFLEKEKIRLDPENKHIQTANNAYFQRDNVSFIGGLVKYLLELRAKWKAQAKALDKNDPQYVSIEQSQGMVKEMANSMFGITGDKSSRYFDQHVAEAITLTGQYMNRLSTYFAEKEGFLTIYGDTDSIFLPVLRDADMDNLIVNVNIALKDYLDNYIGVVDNIVELQYEKTFSTLIMLDKKRYTGRMTMYDGYATDKLFSRGTENIKKNTIKIARTAIIELIDNIVKENSIFSKHDAIQWISKLMKKVMTETLDPSELVTVIRISKSPSKYAVKPVHVRLAERLIDEGKIPPVLEGKQSWGTRLEYIITRNEETGKQDGVLLDEYTGEWDRDYYWDVQIYAPIRRIFEVKWPEHDWSEFTIEETEKRLKKKIQRETKLLKLIESDAKRQARHIAKAEKQHEKRAKSKEKAVNIRKQILDNKYVQSNMFDDLSVNL